LSSTGFRGTVFDIQHFSLHDGPGVRSTIFFKGCPLSCRWCSNPESQDASPQLMFFPHLCVGCGACVAACPSRAVAVKNGSLRIDRAVCDSCGECVPHCLHGARSVSGKALNVQEICEEVRQHWRLFQQSGGGVTLSGGEPLAQPDFLYRLLKELHDEIGLHTCLETSAKAPWDALERILPCLDMLFLDIKHMDSAAHKRGTGAGNGDILDNARRLAGCAVEAVIRVPLMPGFNDDDGNLRAVASFLCDAGLAAVEIMPYHNLGFAKYEALGRTYAFAAKEEPRVSRAVDILTDSGLSVEVHKY
jgi:pyruvate formate lyase activating enzyme